MSLIQFFYGIFIFPKFQFENSKTTFHIRFVRLFMHAYILFN